VTAQKILDYRQQHGAFASVDELDAIPASAEAARSVARPGRALTRRGRTRSSPRSASGSRPRTRARSTPGSASVPRFALGQSRRVVDGRGEFAVLARALACARLVVGKRALIALDRSVLARRVGTADARGSK
jgi:hypothetical protein